MINASDFIDNVAQRGFRFWSGVPCSFLKPFINFVIESPKLSYVAASSEGEAVAISMGAYLAGQKTVTICQNSGLGNTVNPLTSLNFPFKIPTLLITTHRGEPGLKDEPQHELMGQITGQLLDAMRIPWKTFPTQAEEIPAVLDEAEKVMSTGQSFALIMKKGSVSPYDLKEKISYPVHPQARPEGSFTTPKEKRLKRMDAIEAVLKSLDGSEMVIATTGKTGRELFTLGRRPNDLYVVGGMGCASGMALGLALNTKRKVVVIDGDGAALMKMGSFATIGHYQPNNLLHVLIDNEAHESTGGQFTVSGSIDFGQIAAGCAYQRIARRDDAKGIGEAVQSALKSSGPSLIHVKVNPGSRPDLGRPTITPAQVKDEFMEFCARPHEANLKTSR